MESKFYVNGTDTPPEGEIAENSLFGKTDGSFLRYTNGKWVEVNNESGDK